MFLILAGDLWLRSLAHLLGLQVNHVKMSRSVRSEKVRYWGHLYT